MDVKLCPCGSMKRYQECCGVYHNGVGAPNALLLMKSRYSAYAVGNWEYIIATTHPQHVEAKKNREVRKKEIETFSQNTKFNKLEIVDFEEGEKTSTVTFRVYLEQGGKPISYQEKSTFEKINNKWLYLSGIVTN